MFEGELDVSDDSLIGVSGNEHEGLKPFAGEPNSITNISEFLLACRKNNHQLHE